MFDITETIYIQKQDLTHGEPQKAFGQEKEYLTDVSSEIYGSLCQGFIVKDDSVPSSQNKSQQTLNQVKSLIFQNIHRS